MRWLIDRETIRAAAWGTVPAKESLGVKRFNDHATVHEYIRMAASNRPFESVVRALT